MLLFSAPAGAADRLELAVGKGSEQLDAARLAWQRPWIWQQALGENATVTGYHALSVNHWWNAHESITTLGYSPIFIYQDNGSPWYFQGGIGLAYLSDIRIGGRILSTRFQFEDQIGIGWQHRQHGLGLVYRHYSNAGIEKPNHGIDLLLFSYSLTLD